MAVWLSTIICFGLFAAKRHGVDAETAAAQRADELLAAGDVEGQLVWRRIVAAITELRRSQSAKDKRLI